MRNKDDIFTLDFQIQKDNMKLAVTNVFPVYQKNAENQIRRDISEKLYQIYKKYA